jgi:hypothetical protein
MAEVKLQGQRRNDKKGQRGEQRQAVGGLDRLDVEDALERRQDECARHQPRNVRVENDQHAPIECDFVGIHVAFNTTHLVLLFRGCSEGQYGDSSLRSE